MKGYAKKVFEKWSLPNQDQNQTELESKPKTDTKTKQRKIPIQRSGHISTPRWNPETGIQESLN